MELNLLLKMQNYNIKKIKKNKINQVKNKKFK